jgi:8-oxo-dGTP pyrophosphatase MutT (NUDIX family)
MDLPASAGVVLRHGSHYFFLRRSERSRHWPLYWGFPGGKIEEHEKEWDTAKRELLEETGVHIEPIDVVSQIRIRTRFIDGDKDFTLFLCQTWL